VDLEGEEMRKVFTSIMRLKNGNERVPHILKWIRKIEKKIPDPSLVSKISEKK